MVVLKGYFDGGRSVYHDRVTLAIACGTCEEWDAAESAWKRVLTDQNAPSLPTTDVVRLKKGFSKNEGWGRGRQVAPRPNYSADLDLTLKAASSVSFWRLDQFFSLSSESPQRPNSTIAGDGSDTAVVCREYGLSQQTPFLPRSKLWKLSHSNQQLNKY
jgi:hypothetical protein